MKDGAASSSAASVLLSLILSCFRVIFGGKGCCELLDLRTNPSLIIRTLPKIFLVFSIASNHICALPLEE